MKKLDVEEVRDLIRTEEDPAALQAKLVAMIEEERPAPAFKDGEIMPLYEFERRFKRAFCDNVEPRWAQWPVEIRYQTEVTRNGILTGVYVFFGYTPSLSPPCQGEPPLNLPLAKGEKKEGVVADPSSGGGGQARDGNTL